VGSNGRDHLSLYNTAYWLVGQDRVLVGGPSIHGERPVDLRQLIRTLNDLPDTAMSLPPPFTALGWLLLGFAAATMIALRWDPRRR
jgi:hypothetical protein